VCVRLSAYDSTAVRYGSAFQKTVREKWLENIATRCFYHANLTDML
jgi:hypothetical protein